jgi:hypothetical protein
MRFKFMMCYKTKRNIVLLSMQWNVLLIFFYLWTFLPFFPSFTHPYIGMRYALTDKIALLTHIFWQDSPLCPHFFPRMQCQVGASRSMEVAFLVRHSFALLHAEISWCCIPLIFLETYHLCCLLRDYCYLIVTRWFFWELGKIFC